MLIHRLYMTLLTCTCTSMTVVHVYLLTHTIDEDESEEDEDEEVNFFSLLLVKLLSIHDARDRAVR